MEVGLNDGNSNAGNIDTLVSSFIGEEHPLLGENAICSTKDYVVYRVLEFGVKIIPSLLFFILGGIRYSKIRDIGQGRVVYSLHFKLKFVISALMGAAYILYLIITWAQVPTADLSSWVNKCNDDYLVVFYGI